MFDLVVTKAKKMFLDKLTVEVSTSNAGAKYFYTNIGFVKMHKKQIKVYLEQRDRKAKVFEDYLQEEDDSCYNVYILEI